jgi:hypothetical protein
MVLVVDVPLATCRKRDVVERVTIFDHSRMDGGNRVGGRHDVTAVAGPIY